VLYYWFFTKGIPLEGIPLFYKNIYIKVLYYIKFQKYYSNFLRNKYKQIFDRFFIMLFFNNNMTKKTKKIKKTQKISLYKKYMYYYA
jgi:hypothetical protein